MTAWNFFGTRITRMLWVTTDFISENIICVNPSNPCHPCSFPKKQKL
jgi:hypothetical protein